MNKADIIEEFRQRTNAPSRAAAARGVQAFIDIIVGTVAAGGEARVGGLGVFDRSYHKATARRNPNTNEVVEVPGKWVMRFKAATKVKAAVNK
ncbi:nucleoid DNA-binding protein [Nonomuraea thailandensis]|uniref:Nucleoid DNA-binding protein n=1 Tax=Nonomuraea thailandensis TaxID=1188745 RepID=A0A9X2GSU0_9ACTN|nr:HU family DNA-binding protein [Nonomuraea thailandensis]MCP2359803.1 nucleoid DNA-binding protein [Nonomuraea thailandensis]